MLVERRAQDHVETAEFRLARIPPCGGLDLQESPAFNEPFYVVVVEKENEADARQNESFGQWSTNYDSGEGETIYSFQL